MGPIVLVGLHLAHVKEDGSRVRVWQEKSILLRGPVEQNDKGISQNTRTGVLYRNL